MQSQDTTPEEWRPIANYPGYEVSNQGRVKHIKPKTRWPANYILNPRPDKDGYPRCDLSKNGKAQHFHVHRLVASAFLQNPSAPNLQINHIDGDKSNNILENLEWVTPSENTKHAFRIGLNKPPKGSQNPAAKLTAPNIYEIRQSRGIKTAVELAKIYGVTPSNICIIQAGRSWRHLHA